VENIFLICGDKSHQIFSHNVQSGCNIILGDDENKHMENLHMFEKFLNDGGVDCNLGIKNSDQGKRIAFKFDNNMVDFTKIASTGTLSLGNLYVYSKLIKNSLTSNSLVLLDEFDAFYHHELSWLIIEILKKFPNQLILTTHNTVSMDSDLLRPDCMFNMNKKQIRPLFLCTNKDLRKAHNYQKMYIAGSFNYE
jgi:hypothetical protein